MLVQHFHIDERREQATVRLALGGELDLASAPLLQARLDDLKSEHTAVRLDLSKLEFMDSTGLHLLIRALQDARSNGWQLNVDPSVPPQIIRLFELVSVERFILGDGSTGP